MKEMTSNSIIQSKIPDEQTPLAAILAHEADYWTSMAMVEKRSGWQLYHNQQLVPRLNPNHADHFRAAEGTASTIAQDIIAFYKKLATSPAAFVDLLATPKDLIPTLLEAGFQEWPSGANDLMLYVGPDEVQPSSIPVTTVRTEQQKMDWATIIEEEADSETRRLLNLLYYTEISDPRMTAYLAYVDGVPASRCELFSWNGLGRVEAVRTLIPYRGQGLAAALIRQAIRDSMAQGNQLTYIYAEPNGQAQRLYHRLGFRTVAAKAIRMFIYPRENLEAK